VVIQFVHVYGDMIASVVYMGKHGESCHNCAVDCTWRPSPGILVTLALVLAFATIYPKPAKGWAASYGTSAQIFGSWMGIASALWWAMIDRNWSVFS
jgi:hypothetical protein